MSLLRDLGRGLDTAVLGGTFQRAAQDREMHRLDVDRIKQNIDFQKHQMYRQKSFDSINQAKDMAAFDDLTIPVQSDRVQQILNPMQQQEVANAGVIGLQQYERPVDQSRRSDIQLLDGTTRTMERRTPEDLVARGLDRERQSVVNRGVATAEADDKIRKRLGIPLPANVAKTLGTDPDFRVKPGEMRGYVDAAIDSDRITNDRDRWTAGRTAKQVYKTEIIESAEGQVERTVYRDGTYEDRPVQGQVVRPGVQRTTAGKQSGGGKPPAITQRADEFIQKVQQESDAKGGNRPEDYLRNVDQFYKDTPASLKAKARNYFKSLAKGKPSDQAPQPKPAQAAAPITATNRQTGQKITLKDGKWVAM